MKKLNILILTLAILLLSSCGAEFRLVSYAQSNQVSASSVSTSFGPSLVVANNPNSTINFSVYSNPRLALRHLSPWDFGLHDGMWTHCRTHGFHDLSTWDPMYSPIFCRPSHDFMWAIRGNFRWESSWTRWSPHRWSPFGYDRWGYSSYYGWNNWNYGWGWNGIYNPYQGWPYWNNNVYASPYWRQNMPNSVYINGRRGSSNIISNRTNSNIETNVNRRRNSNNNNSRVRVYKDPNKDIIIRDNNNVRIYRRPNDNDIRNNNDIRVRRDNNNLRNNNNSNINSNRSINNNRNYYTPPPVRNNPVRTSSPTNTRSSQGQTIKRSGGRK